MKKISVAIVGLLLFFCFSGWTSSVHALNEKVKTDNLQESEIVTIYLVRHGKTILNNTDRAQGWADGPLIPEGEKVIKKVGKELAKVPFIGAYSSDSGRAIQTAKLILAENRTTAKQLPLIEEPKIREVYFGSFEGEKLEVLLQAARTYAGIHSDNQLLTRGENQYEQLINILAKMDESGEAENYQQLTERVFSGFTDIAERALRQGGGNILVVSHGITINAILAQIDANKVPQGIFKNGSVVRIEFNGENWRVIEVNEI